MRRAVAMLALLAMLTMAGCEAKPETLEQARQRCITRWINAYPNGSPCYGP